MTRRRQSGIVMIAMLAVIMMSAAWFTVRSLAALPGAWTGAASQAGEGMWCVLRRS